MVNPLELNGRAILVTGASSGIGRQTALLLSQLGARLVLVGRDQERLSSTLAILQGDGHRVEVFDLAASEEIPPWLKAQANSYGPFDGLVHSAGMHQLRPLRVLGLSALDQILRINVHSAIALAKGFSQRGVHSPPGSIVFLSSVAAQRGQAGASAYSASKGAVSAATRALAVELAGQGVRVNCVAPGVVITPMGEDLLNTLPPDQRAALEAKHLLGFGAPQDVAYAIAFLLADTARWVTGTTLIIDGGFSA